MRRRLNAMSSGTYRFVLLTALPLVFFAVASLAQDVCPNPVVDDSHVHIASVADIATTRTNLIQYIWGQSTLPNDSDVVLTANVTNPIGCSVDLARVDELQMTLGPTVSVPPRTMPARAYHFVPVNSRHRLVIVHDGHMPENNCTTPFLDAEDGFSPYGLQMTINALLADGFDVLALMMPLFQPDDCSQDHNALFDPDNAPLAGGAAIRYFLDPVRRSLNYLLQQQTFADVSMLGLSGGGWTTTVYAAVDPRITTSFPVAGSLPLSMRNPTPSAQQSSYAMGTNLRAALAKAIGPVPDVISCGEFSDRENSLPEFYEIAGYPDLYVLGAYGAGRSQVQILNRRDNCCFGQSEHRDPATFDSDIRGYEHEVRSVLRRLGQGEFRLEVDEAATQHMISRNTTHNLILGELEGGHRGVGAYSSAHAFKRGFNGTLWHYGGHGWQDLGYSMIGAPAVIENAVHAIDVVMRSEVNSPQHVYYDGTQWYEEALIVANAAGDTLPGNVIISDPALLSRAAGQLEVLAFGRDFGAYRWTLSDAAQTFDRAGGNDYAVGSPSLAATPSGNLSAYYRSAAQTTAPACIEQPRVLYQLVANDYAQWQPEQRIGGVLAESPEASTDQAVVRVFSTGLDGVLSAAISVDGSHWSLVSADAGGIEFMGRPSRPFVANNVIRLLARATDDDLMQVLYDDAWTVTPLNLAQTDPSAPAIDSPSAVEGGVYWTGRDRQVWYDGGAQAQRLSDDVILADGFDF